jgi:hypothetical protein
VISWLQKHLLRQTRGQEVAPVFETTEEIIERYKKLRVERAVQPELDWHERLVDMFERIAPTQAALAVLILNVRTIQNRLTKGDVKLGFSEVGDRLRALERRVAELETERDAAGKTP